MNTDFIIAFLICFTSYAYHTIEHWFESKGKEVKLPHWMFEILLMSGYFAWGYMVYSDPVKTDFPSWIIAPIGVTIGLVGLILGWQAHKELGTFDDPGRLVTTGVFSKMRHPFYVGMSLVHIGFPLAFQSVLTLASAILWIGMMFLWKDWEEKELIEKYGEEYREYQKRTAF